MRSTTCSQRPGSATHRVTREQLRLLEFESRLAALDPDALAPRDALAALYELKRLVER